MSGGPDETDRVRPEVLHPRRLAERAFVFGRLEGQGACRHLGDNLTGAMHPNLSGRR